ncbi:MAG: ATP-binding cassette domain-containing protein [Candidatus Omnitrophica bacterium]|nr:ATP-binding cassette domain-containing protein [Candidatus Omnitrophota bacterium]
MISVQNLTMNYGKFRALQGVSFSMGEKEILGLLGPNGAGKTTAMRIITTYLYPTSGTVTVGGHDVVKQPLEVRKLLGYLPEAAPLYQDMQVEEYLRFVGEARGIYGAGLDKRLGWVKEACQIESVWRHTVFELSKGYRQRVGLAQALIHNPRVLILDEPTSGLDPLQIIGIRDLIRRLAEEKTIIFSTHILQEVGAIADRIVIINDGRVISDGTREELSERTSRFQNVHLVVKGDMQSVESELKLLGVCDEIHCEGHSDGGFVRFRITSRSKVPVIPLIDELVKKQKWPLAELVKEDASLEETFISLLREDAAARRKVKS